MPIAERDDAWLAWRAVGPHEPGAPGEPVLMIMGLSGSALGWWRLVPHVSRRHRAVVYDNRGTGSSDPVRGPLTMRGMVADALAVLDAAGIERAHVIGASMGGMIAQHLALEHPDRVASLVLACTTAYTDRTSPPWRLLLSAVLRPVLGAQRITPVLAGALYADATIHEQPERIEEDMAMRLVDPTPALTTYAQLAAIAGHDTRHRLGELADIPTTVIHGDQDRTQPLERGRELADLIPGARLEVVPAGHLFVTDAEAESVDALDRHLAAVAGRAAVSR
jgi:pimeloyl-ACP methyl ester carboxylesterase